VALRYTQSFSVTFRYNVIFTHDLFAPSNDVLSEAVGEEGGRILFFIDDGLLVYWPQLPMAIQEWLQPRAATLECAAPIQLVTGGEGIKNDLSILDRVGELAAACGLCRHSSMVIIGGGAVLDAVGFAASTIHRGIRQIRVPTTVLGQLDSGVGVKNGLNRFGMKNFYGFFAPPSAVINDSRFLETLSSRDWISGLSEAFKVAIIKDKSFLDFLWENGDKLRRRDDQVMSRVIRRCAELHLNHIRESEDAFERGSTRPLDFGHWAAHRLESISGHSLRHGEAVAIGIALDLYCSVSMGLISAEECEYICSAMKRCGLSLWHDSLLKRSPSGELEILAGIEQFREHMGGRLTLAMPCGLGSYTDISDLPHNLVVEAIERLKKRSAP
jgi:3-dehydroquinate synthase